MDKNKWNKWNKKNWKDAVGYLALLMEKPSIKRMLFSSDVQSFHSFGIAIGLYIAEWSVTLSMNR